MPHQVEMRVRWPAWLSKKGKMTPASHKDSLVLVAACVVEVEAKNSTNESLQLAGAGCGLHGQGRVVEGE